MTTVPTTRTFVAAEVVLASYFNTNIRDPLNYLLAPPILELKQTSSQTITTATYTAYNYDTETVDSSGMHSTVTNTSRATAVYPGWYEGGGAVTMATSGTGLRASRWATNGTALNASGNYVLPLGGFVTIVPMRAMKIFLNVNDYATAEGFQSSGGNLGTGTTTTEQSSMTFGWKSN